MNERKVELTDAAHHIVWELRDTMLHGTVICEDPECLGRYVCVDAPCEVYFDVRREPDGTVTHKPWEDERPAINRHRMEKRECNVELFLNADPYSLVELQEESVTFELGRTPIDLVWQGEDGVLWKPSTMRRTALPVGEEKP